MKRTENRKTHRFFRHTRFVRRSLPQSVCFLSAGYLLGCLIGSLVAIKADVSWLTNLSADPVDSSASAFLSAFCGYGAYGVGLLLLATSYLGFFLIPFVLAVRGAISGCVFTAMMRSAADYGLYRSLAELLLPGVFLLSALLILGRLCMLWSVRLFRLRAGESLPPGNSVSGPLAAVLILLLMASAMKIYALPALLGIL